MRSAPNDTRSVLLLAGVLNVLTTLYVWWAVIGLPRVPEEQPTSLITMIAVIHAVLGVGAMLVVFVTMALMGTKRASRISNESFFSTIIVNLTFGAFPVAFALAYAAKPCDKLST